MRKILKQISCIAIAIAIGFFVGRMPTPKGMIKFELVNAFSNEGNAGADCVEPNDDERKAIELAVSTLEVTGKNRDILWLDIGARKFLSGGLFRHSIQKPQKICIESQIYQHVSDIITESKGFNRGRLVEYELELAAKFPKPSQYVVDAIANSAFEKTPQQSEIFTNKDIRPMARSVLAGFGDNAVKYSDRAFEEMSADDSMGTGAAQIAVATGHKDALAKVSEMMMKKINTVPENGLISWNDRNRLYELSYAILLAGKEAINYTAPIKALMKRKVQSWAPPFGMLELNPKRMCNILKKIEGEQSIQSYAYCTDKSSFEQ